MDAIDAEWLDIWAACERSGLVTWQDWIGMGVREALLSLSVTNVDGLPVGRPTNSLLSVIT